MRRISLLMLSLGVASLGMGMSVAISQSDMEQRPSRESSRDAVMEAQTPRETPIARPEQRKNEHDRSNIFSATNAKPSSPAFENQPDKGKTLGFEFYRDPLNAKKPMQAFEETMKADIADRPKVMRTQRDLLMRRYDLTPRLDREAKMSRGKPLAVGPTARPHGCTRGTGARRRRRSCTQGR